ncbi:retrotransposon protein, putative, ty1-copia subclass [Tanacetum coccineum]|uniref:Retrotransposon protein, putative, ty1-copia subclass n=1 Tax=Tanacetum coccineum TaxID=301880 RepID=A0ABQ4XVB3_9ASTR
MWRPMPKEKMVVTVRRPMKKCGKINGGCAFVYMTSIADLRACLTFDGEHICNKRARVLAGPRGRGRARKIFAGNLGRRSSNHGGFAESERKGSKLALPVLQGFRIERKLKQGALYLYVGNGVRAQVEAIGSFDLILPNSLESRHTSKISVRAVDLGRIQEEEDITPLKSLATFLKSGVFEKKPPQGVRDLHEPTSYKAAMLDLEYNKWVDAMNAEIQSMMDNMVWVMVDLPLGSRLVAKGYTQLYGVDYEETFSPVAIIRAIRIFISIAAYYEL